MLLAHTPRPATYSVEFIAQTLADSAVDIRDSEEGCRLAMLEAIGVVPNVEDWALVRTLAMVLRRSQAGGFGL